MTWVSECWAINKKEKFKTKVVEMRMLRLMYNIYLYIMYKDIYAYRYIKLYFLFKSML